MQKAKNILLCPLDWGLGHASRCVPIIDALRNMGHHVIIGASGRPLAFLQQEFPDLKYIDFPGYNIRYPQNSSMYRSMLLQAPKILKRIKQEHKRLKSIVGEHQIDLVISDNRYGLWHPDIPSVIMSHQLRIMAGSRMEEAMLRRINFRYLRKFTACWVPDVAGERNLSGALSHFEMKDLAPIYIGPQSRFSVYQQQEEIAGKYELLVSISGPEPQRSLFEKKVLEQIQSLKIKTLILAGKPGEDQNQNINKWIEYRSHMDSRELKQILLNAEMILSRPGYSTIMDLASLGKKAIFIPTPGQTEQEYLARYHAGQGHCVCAEQKDFQLAELINACKSVQGFDLMNETSAYQELIESLFKDGAGAGN
ncbi:MAG: glycosyltransferase family protein [Bacteroidota bacterium]|nr:glycosyltransferase family protein [Bacteroidota bacterium]